MKSWGSQRDRILHLLQSRAGQWVPLYEITPLAAQYNTRIKELRERGHIIDNHTRHVNGVVHSWFRLVEPEPKRIGRHFLEVHPRGFSDVG